ncbi:MAG: NAD(P)/FAD-dependent oxidoreductase [Gammaproteobacteria bacterium]
MQIGIIGGGLMGLALARRLSDRGHNVSVYEADSQLGGLATHHDYGAFIWDRFYHVILPTDTHLLNFLNEIGLREQVGWSTTQTGFFVDEQFHSLNSSMDFLRFPPLGLWSKFRLAFTILYCSRVNDWRRLEQIPVDRWLTRLSGRNTFEKLWKPLLLAKLGIQYQRVSAVFIWTYIKRMFSARDSAAQKEQLGYVSGGYRSVFETLRQDIVQAGGNVHTEVKVRGITPSARHGIQLQLKDGIASFDKVVFTAPTSILSRMVTDSLVSVEDRGSAVEYLGVVCVVLVTRQPLMPYYVLNIADARIPFTGVIGMTNVVPSTETAGLFLTYLPKYVMADDPLLKSTDDEIMVQFLAGLNLLFPELDQEQIVSCHVNRAARVQPLQVLGFSQIVQRCETRHPDFFVLNTAQFVAGTLNNNEVIGAVDHFMAQHGHEFTD